MKYLLILSCVIITFQSCQENSNNQKEVDLDSITTSVATPIYPPFPPPNLITGDFTGSGTIDSLLEVIVDNKKNVIQYPTHILSTYEDLVEYATKKSIQVLLKPNFTLDTLSVNTGGSAFRLFHLKNEGDLNNDGSDEVSYVIDWADYSSLNTYHIITYKNGAWHKLYSFPIWEWQLDSARKNDKSLVEAVGKTTIKCFIRNEESEEDSVIIHLKEHVGTPKNKAPELYIKDSTAYELSFLHSLTQFEGPSTIDIIDTTILFDKVDTIIIPTYRSAVLTAKQDSIAVALSFNPNNLTSIRYKLEYHCFGKFTHFYEGLAVLNGLFFLGSENDVSSLSDLGYGSTEYTDDRSKNHSIRIRLGYEPESGPYLLGRVLLESKSGDSLDFNFPTLVEK